MQLEYRRHIEPFFTQRFSGAAAIYSLRKLSPTATNCIRVRRSSDNAEQDIGFVLNRLDIASLLSFVGAGSGFVTVWYDQSGLGNDLTQTTAARQPRIVNSGTLETQLGLPCLRFVSASIHFMASAVIPNQTVSNLWHGIVTSTTNTNTLQSHSFISNGIISLSNIQHQLNRVYVFSGLSGYASNTNTNTKLIEHVFNGAGGTDATNLLEYINNAQQTLTFSGTRLSSITTSSHVIQIGGYSGAYLNGSISELMYYFTDTANTRAEMARNINRYYGIY
jgi:hypothetical protein